MAEHEETRAEAPQAGAEDTAFWEAVGAQIDSGHVDDLEAAFAAVAERAAEWASQNPIPYLDLLADGHSRAEAGDWEGCEAAYRQALTLAGEPGDQVQVRWHLAGLHAALGRDRQALDEARAATAAARASGWGTVVAIALQRQAHYSLAAGEVAEALAASEEALAALRGESIQTLLRAQVQVERARCRIARADLAGASADLDAAWAVLAPMAAPSRAAGCMAAVARWYATSSDLRAAQGDAEGASAAMAQAVAYREHVARAPQLPRAFSLARVASSLRELAAMRRAAGDRDGAEAALQESRLVRRELGLPESGADD